MKIVSKIKQRLLLNKIGRFFWDKLPHSGVREGEKINFASEIQGSRLSTIYELIKIIKPCDEIFFSNGSFGDHILHCSLLRSSIMNGEKNNICIMYDENYHELYTSYFEDLIGVQLTPLIGYINSSLDAYFINASEWLKGFFPIKPLLPIYYPLIPSMVEYHQSISHVGALKSIIGVPKNLNFSEPSSYTNLKKIALNNLKACVGNDRKIIVAPVSNSIEGIPITFWIELVRKIAITSKVVVNIPVGMEGVFQGINIFTTHLRPHLAVASIDVADCFITAPSGLANMAKIFTSTKQVVVCDYRDLAGTTRAKLKSAVPANLQHIQFTDCFKGQYSVIRYQSDKEMDLYIDHVLNEIE